MKSRGFTLIELLIVITIATIALSVSVPSFTSVAAKLRLEGALGELSVDMQYARSQALRERGVVTLAVNAAGDGYTITGTNGAMKTVTMARGVSLTPSVSVSFDGLRGMAAAATIVGSSSAVTGTLRIVTNALGRVQMCSPSGSLSGYTAC